MLFHKSGPLHLSPRSGAVRFAGNHIAFRKAREGIVAKCSIYSWTVIPAEAEIQDSRGFLDARVRGHDTVLEFRNSPRKGRSESLHAPNCTVIRT